MLDGFGECMVFVEATGQKTHSLVNGILIAGKDLVAFEGEFPGDINPKFWEKIDLLFENGRAARTGAPVGTEDHSDLD